MDDRAMQARHHQARPGRAKEAACMAVNVVAFAIQVMVALWELVTFGWFAGPGMLLGLAALCITMFFVTVMMRASRVPVSLIGPLLSVATWAAAVCLADACGWFYIPLGNLEFAPAPDLTAYLV
jgi:hypothetical protein